MPDPRSASEPQFLCQISNRELRVVDFTAKEEISSTYEVNLTLASEDEINFDDVIGKEALLTVLGEEADRYFHGIINEFMQTGRSGRFCLYRATMVPSLWLLSLEQDCRIFQEKSVQDIVTQVLQDAGITSDLFEFRLQGQYEPKEYCVQYRETDLNFISRLLEEEGIFYFFEHFEDKHLLAFGDSTVNYQPIPGEQNDEAQTEVPYHAPDSMVPVTEYAYNVVLSRQIQSGKVTLKDFNFEKPSLNLTAQNQAQSFENLEMYDYPGEYFDESRGSKLAEIRLQESTMLQDKAEGHSTCPRLNPCFTFKLTDHDYGNFNQEYLLVEVFHSGSQPQVLEEQAGSGHSSYFNQFLCVPSPITIRPERNTPKPIMEGVQTAIVVGPSGEEIYTDEHGRVKVQFHWDREGKNDENSSCWIRVSQLWAGAGWGAVFLPHIGHEIIVDFIEGDPDRPIVTGRVYHGTNTPADALPGEKTKSVIRSYGDNDIVIEDKDGDKCIHIKQACGNEIRMHESSPDIEIKQECGNEILMKASGPDIEIKQACGNEILMHEADGIQIRDKYGNEVVLDAAAGFMRLASPSHNSVIELGKSTYTYTDSNGVRVTHGDSEEEVYGDTKKLHVGHTKEEFGGTKQSYSLAATEEFFVGAKVSQMTGVEVKTNISKEVSKNILSYEKRATKKIEFDSKDSIHLIGGAGKEGKIEMNAYKVHLNSGGTSIRMNKDGDIIVVSKGKFKLLADGEIKIGKGMVMDANGQVHFSKDIDQPSVNAKK